MTETNNLLTIDETDELLDPTQNVARRLAALEALGHNAPQRRAEAGLKPLDLSGERGDVYGYESEAAQR